MYHIFLDGPYPQLLLPHPSGITFTAQTGGVACLHPAIEGVLLPLPDRSNDAGTADIARLAHLLEEIHPGCWAYGVTGDEADQLDAAFVTCFMPIIVNREHLQESMEAWLHVRLREKEEHWRPAESEERLQEIISVAARYNRHIGKVVTETTIRETWENARAGLDGLDDFAGREAILTWANCD